MLNRWSSKQEEASRNARILPWSNQTLESSARFVEYAAAKRKVNR